MAVTFTNNDNYIEIDNNGEIRGYSKKIIGFYTGEDSDEITVEVNGNVIYNIPYTEVTSPSAGSASALVAILNTYLNENLDITVDGSSVSAFSALENQLINGGSDYEDFRLVAYRNSVSNTNFFLPLWPFNTNDDFIFLATAQTLTVSSSRNQDSNPSGNGARQILIEGLDNNGDPISETVNLNGQTGVSTSNQYLRVNKARIVTAAPGETTAVGEIYIGNGTVSNGINSQVVYFIEEGIDNEGLVGLYTVPNNKKLIINNINLTNNDSSNGRRASVFSLKQKNINDTIPREVARFTVSFEFTSSGNTPYIFDELTDIYFLVLKGNSGSSVNPYVSISGYLYNLP